MLSMTKYVTHAILRKLEESISKVEVCVCVWAHTHTHTLLSMTKYVTHTILRNLEESLIRLLSLSVYMLNKTGSAETK